MVYLGDDKMTRSKKKLAPIVRHTVDKVKNENS